MNAKRLILSRQTGFSLMELMIAITIGFIVVAGVGYLYLGSSQTFKAQDNLSAIQENSRFALDTMSRDIRMAGYLGCGSLASIPINNVTNVPHITIPVGGLQIYPGGAGWTAPVGVTRVSGDVLSVASAQSSGVTVTGNMTVLTANIQIAGNVYGYLAGTALIVSDCQNADVFQATGVSSSAGVVTVAHASNLNAHNFLSKLYGTTSPPAQVYSLQQTDYFLGCPNASWAAGQCNVPVALYQVINNGVPQPLVDNVENMAFSLGVGAGQVVTPPYQTPTQVAAANNWVHVLTVQVNLLMVGSPAKDAASNVGVVSQPYNFIVNGATYATYPADRRMRQAVVATIAIRNHLP